MEKHTPGPWMQGRPLTATGITPIKTLAGRQLVAHVTHPKWGYEDTPADPVECSANARLIAAAPELLAAIENAANVLAGIACGDLKTIRPDSAALKQARAAIAKAKGI